MKDYIWFIFVIEALHLPPILVITRDQISENVTLPEIPNIKRNKGFVTLLLMLVTVNQNNHCLFQKFIGAMVLL